MPDFVIAIFLGIIEGITEFLPISSTGHLIIFNKWFYFSELNENFEVMFNVVIQLGAILAVIVLFWNKLWLLDNKSFIKKESVNIWKKVLIAFIPAVILGFVFGGFIEEKLFNTTVVSVALIIGGILMILAEKISSSKNIIKNEINNENKEPVKINSVEKIDYKTAFYIGLFQCLAMIPGTSRSAASIIGGLFLGANRQTSVEFSFFLAIPTMIGASVYAFVKGGGLSMNYSEYYILATGFIVSFVVALFVIKAFVKYIQVHDFKVFGYYRIIVGIIVFLIFK